MRTPENPRYLKTSTLYISYQCYRVKRQESNFAVRVGFEFVLWDIYEGSLTASEIDERTFEQFISLADYFTSYVNEGHMDLPGLTTQHDSVAFNQPSLACPLGTVAAYQTYTCRK